MVNGLRKGSSFMLATLACSVALSGASPALAGTFVEADKIELASPSDGAQFGTALDIDGDRLLVGAPNQRFPGALGAAYIYERGASGAWVEVAELVASNGGFPDGFGVSVSLDGDRALVGARFADGGAQNSGAAYVFERDAGGAWTEVALLTHPGAAERDFFGGSVSLEGDRALVGSVSGDGDVAGAGAAYVFERDAAGVWAQTQRLSAADAEDGDQFGNVARLSGDRAIVSAFRDGDGSAYVFEPDAAGVWQQVHKFEAPASPPRRNVDDFARVVSLEGDRVLIGDPKGTSEGVVLVYERDAAGDWLEVATLSSTSSAAGDFFGGAVALQGDRAVVGAIADVAANRSGAAYVFERGAGGAWSEVQRLTASDAAIDDYFSNAVAFSGDDVAVGAYFVDGVESNSGAVYMFGPVSYTHLTLPTIYSV